MQTPTLLVHIWYLLLPALCCGEWFNDVIAAGHICEKRYPEYRSCLGSTQCVLKFMDCECVPNALMDILMDSPQDGHSLCLYADIIMGLGKPKCCDAQKRNMLRNFQTRFFPSGSELRGRLGTGETAGADRQIPETTTAIKRTSPLGASRGQEDLESTVLSILNGASKTHEAKSRSKERSPRRDDDDDDDIEELIRTLYDYLRHLLKVKEKDESMKLGSLK